MKGQRLFVRAATPGDRDAIEAFYSGEGIDSQAMFGSETTIRNEPGALIGKLVGEVVAHLTFSLGPESVRIETIYVARVLRRKWIGRFMVAELGRIARDSSKFRLETSSRCDASEFFRALGFKSSSTDATTLIKAIESEEDM